MNTRLTALCFLSATSFLTACSSTEAPLSKSIDYQSANPPARRALEVPPDLTAPNLTHAYIVPQTGSVTASDLAAQRTSAPQSPKSQNVLKTVPNVHLERDGSRRWLVVQKSPDELWPLLEEFWQDLGFVLKQNEPQLGILETDWAENRAKLPHDGIRSLLSKVGLDGLYATPERDKFRTRIERTAHGTEVYFTHRGMVEIYTDEGKNQIAWQMRPTDPELEAEFLGRFMLRLGVDETRARNELKPTQEVHSTSKRAQLVDNTVIVQDGFDRAWRRTGLALDRMGLVVLDRNRQDGLYYVRPVDTDFAEGKNASSGGFLSKLAFWRSAPTTVTTTEHHIHHALRLKLSSQGATYTHIQVLPPLDETQKLSADMQAKVLKALQQQLQ